MTIGVPSIEKKHVASAHQELFVLSLNYENIEDEGFRHIVFNEEEFNDQLKSIDSTTFSSSVILRTCNRIEFYGVGQVSKARELLLQHIVSNQPIESRLQEYTGEEACLHLLHVAAGLKSKLMGDAEILGQFKKSFKEAKTDGRLCGFMERLANKAIECAKDVRTNTNLVSGSTSMAFAVIKLLNQASIQQSDRILLIGMGDLGKLVAKNILKFYPENTLTVTNRSTSRYEDLQANHGFEAIPFEGFRNQVDEFDIVISALGGTHEPILLSQLKKEKTIIDLSVPALFNSTQTPTIAHRYLTIDDAADSINKTIHERTSSIPKAEQIVKKHNAEFIAWAHFHKYSDQLAAWSKAVRNSLKQCPFLAELQEDELQSLTNKNVGHFAGYIKTNKQAESQHESKIEEYLSEHEKLTCQNHCHQKLNNSTPCTIHQSLE